MEEFPNKASRATRATRGVLAVAAAVIVALATFLWVAGLFDRDPVRMFAVHGRRAPIAAVYFSGDMGLRYGMGAATSRTLAAHGIETVGFSSSTLFAVHRSIAETDAIIAGAVREAIRRTGSDRIVLIGQSYGADVLQFGVAALPTDLRRHVAAVILVVPGDTVFLRADPSGLNYRTTPDSLGVSTARTIGWTPVTCIYGIRETDSLCPSLTMPNVRVVALPGGHFLDHDADRLSAEVLKAIARIDRSAIDTNERNIDVRQ